MLSGHPDVAIPLVLAGETAYLGFLGTHPRFQKFVDAQDHKTARAQADAEAVERLKNGLPPAHSVGSRRSETGAWPCARLPSSCESPPVPIHSARSTSCSSPISTACCGFIYVCSTRSTCSNNSSRKPAPTRLTTRFAGSKTGSASWKRSPIPPTAPGSGSPWRPTSIRAVPGSPTSTKRARITNCCRPRSKTSKPRSSRLPSWRSTVAIPKLSPVRSNRSPRA